MSSQPRQRENLGDSGSIVEGALQDLERERVVERIWDAEAALWKPHQRVINNALG